MTVFARFLAGALIALAAVSVWADALDEAMKTQTAIDRSASTTQSRVDRIADQTQQLLAEYRLATRRTDSLRIYNTHLEKLIKSQIEEIASTKRQIESLESTNRDVVPLMLRMLDALENFVALDLPFLGEERRTRLAGLRAMMDRADITTSEKYRRIMDAYQVENEYGRTIEAYRGPLSGAAGERTVDFLRMGRIILLYQTLDGAESGYWEPEAKQWVELPGSYRQSITQGLRIARKQAAPDLLRLPVRAPETAQ